MFRRVLRAGGQGQQAPSGQPCVPLLELGGPCCAGGAAGLSTLQGSFRRAGEHVVFNQARPFVDVDQVLSDRVLSRALSRLLTDTEQNQVRHFGNQCGSTKFMSLADDAEANRPSLRQFDNYGNRIDVIEFHDSYHSLMRNSIESGCTVHGHKDAGNPSAHITRAALLLQANQLEPGHCCPVTMTSAAVPVLRDPHSHPFVAQFLQKVMTGKYDPANAPISSKTGATIGMSMTEKQGGSDVRANTTIATRRIDGGGAYSLRGHKWFTSAGMSDAFLTLAKVDSQDALPSCFLVPRWLPDGSRNSGFHLVRMKRKLADLANASSEVEYHDCLGYPVGEEGKGVKTILQMVQLTRLDCCIGSTGGMRRALQVAINHTNTRSAFGVPLIKQPLMEQLLAELCVEAEAHTLSTMRMAQAYGKGEEEAEIFRVGVAIMKYYTTKSVPHFTYECLETLGGNGFTEDFPAAKLFRHSPLNAIWEGSGNVMALDVLRASKVLPAFLAEIVKSRGADSSLDAFVSELTKSLRRLPTLTLHEQQANARNLCDRLALAFQASLLVETGLPESAKLFIGRSIAGRAVGGPRNYGASALASSHESQTIIQDSLPVFSSI